MPGASLSEVLPRLHESELLVADRRLPWIVARIVAGLAAELHGCHERGVVHGGLSPQRLFVLRDGSLRVAGGRRESDAAYRAPEQLERGETGPQSDVWSLGVVAWELLVGRRLFRCSGERATTLAVLTREIEPPSYYRKSVPEALDRIVMRALERDRGARYETARELARDLEHFLEQSADKVPPERIAAWVAKLSPEADEKQEADSGREEAFLLELRHRARARRLSGALLFGVSLAASGLVALQFFSGRPLLAKSTTAAHTGLVSVSTPGASVEVFHRGVLIGKTPLSVSLSAGKHELVLRDADSETRITVPVSAGEPTTVSIRRPAPLSRAP